MKFKSMEKVFTYLRFKYYYWLGKRNPKKLVSLRYRRTFGVDLNWDKPITLNEKINWLKFNSDTSTWSLLTDKYRVREYVESKGYKDALVKLYGKWDKAEDINWENLPNKFVMKVNNGSGDILVCRDKTRLDIDKVTKTFAKHLKKGFGYSTGEPHYKSIPPCIIAEELLDSTKQPIESSSLIDYKIWCFNGEPECVWACYDRTKQSVKVATYDLSWNCHPEYSVYIGHYQKAEKLIPRPKSLEKMLQMAATLSQGFPQVRVDLYEVDNKPYFGEMTFTSNMGLMDFYTSEYLIYLGSKVRI